MQNALIVMGLDAILGEGNPLAEEAERIGWIINEVVGAGMGRAREPRTTCFDALIWGMIRGTEGKMPKNLRRDRIRHQPERFATDPAESIFLGTRVYGPTYGTATLDNFGLFLLNHEKINRIAFCGLADNESFAASALDAKHGFGFETYIMEDAVTGTDPAVLARTLSELGRAGIPRITSEEIIKTWIHGYGEV